MLRRFLAIALAALLMAVPALSEDGLIDGLREYDGFAEVEGYSGEWTAVEALNFEFCLPDGWSVVEPAEDEDFAAERADGAVKLHITAIGAAVEDIVGWGEANLGTYESDTVNFYDVLIEEGNALTIYVNYLEDNLVAFRFEREGVDCLGRGHALEIVASAYPLWEGEDFFADYLSGTDYFEIWG